MRLGIARHGEQASGRPSRANLFSSFSKTLRLRSGVSLECAHWRSQFRTMFGGLLSERRNG